MAGIYEYGGDTDKAIREYTEALNKDPNSYLIHTRLAAVYVKKDENSKAIEELKAASVLDPDAVEPHAVLALVYLLEKKNDLAATESDIALRNASKLEPKNKDIYKNLGLVYLRQK
jgi:Tfp pilus assembly protein PilF